MTNFLNTVNNFVRSFAKDEEGAQIIEYALIIAVISLVLIVAIAALTKSDGGFTSFIGKITTCFKTPASCVA